MTPIITLVGRPNVGKSTLFNRLTKSSKALVLDYEGLTRDRIYGFVHHETLTDGKTQSLEFMLIDTPGLFTQGELAELSQAQTQTAIAEADLILILLDLRAGLLKEDVLLVNYIRTTSKPFLLLVNKTDGAKLDDQLTDFYTLGQELHRISAIHGTGLASVFTHINQCLALLAVDEPTNKQTNLTTDKNKTAVAVVGRPNAGKSSLINRLLGEERLLSSDHPGTTRDSIKLEWTKAFDLLDTAGVRRRKQVKESVEKLSVGKTLQTIRDADIVILLIDAKEGMVDQDLHLLSFIVESGRGLIIAINKWDLLHTTERQKYKNELLHKIPFATYAKWLYLSALTGKGCNEIMPALRQTAKSINARWTPPHLTKLLEQFIGAHELPACNNRRIKLRYAHQGGNNPLTIVIHGNQVTSIPDAYKRYLINKFQQELKLAGTPIQIIFKAGKNPYAGKPNKLTPRQIAKKRRLMRFVKRKKK